MRKASIVIPTYNEAPNVPVLIDELVKHLNGIDFEIILVDDDSPDGTWLKAIEEIVKRKLDGIVVRRLGIKGLATAVLDGISFAKGRYAIVMDADLQHPPHYVPKLIKALDVSKCDIAIATRYAPGGGVEGWSLIRKTISRLATLIAKLLLPEARKVSDPMSGFFAVNRDLVVNSREYLNPIGYKVLLEILSRTNPRCIIEVPYTFKPRLAGKSKLGIKQILHFILHVLTLSGWRPLKFALVGLAGTVVNLATLALLTLFMPILTSKLFALGSAIAIEVSTLFNFSLHEKWTFSDRRLGNPLNRLAKFHLSVAPAVATQYLVANALKYIAHLNPLVAQFIGIVLGFVVNYVLSELKVWKGKRINVVMLRET